MPTRDIFGQILALLTHLGDNYISKWSKVWGLKERVFTNLSLGLWVLIRMKNYTTQFNVTQILKKTLILSL